MPRQYKIPSRLWNEYKDFIAKNPYINDTHPGQTYATAFLKKARDLGKLNNSEKKYLKKFLGEEKQSSLNNY